MVIDSSGRGVQLKVGVTLDVGLRGRTCLTSGPRSWLPLRSADSDTMSTSLERAGRRDGTLRGQADTDGRRSEPDISVELFDPTGDLDVWGGRDHPSRPSEGQDFATRPSGRAGR